MNLIGIISTTHVMAKSELWKKAKPKKIQTEFGPATIYLTESTALILRHGNDPDHHILPHMINYRANLGALQKMGVTEIVGVNSSGSLKKGLPPGVIVIPDDFIAFTAPPTVFRDSATHITPDLNEEVRRKLIKAAQSCSIPVREKATYWQTPGPRLETKAEIKMMSNFADIVGMTMASEAIIARELGLRYASACSVDNFCHGILDEPLSMEKILAGTRKNAALIRKLLQYFIKEP